ncbi:PKD domain-containing protein [Pseudoalteromonas fenneropenaei]|uniref:PKD domain-containing protein n=1 Tax=Pseudoalteromonas fenneropenaei TaxID=1737459 RepID=A0ABV7CL79_9GAMM
MTFQPNYLNVALLCAGLCSTGVIATETTVLSEAQMLKYTSKANKTIVAQINTINLPLSAMATPTLASQNAPQTVSQTINHPNASYIKLHFKNIDLSKGGKLIVSAPDGSESYQYTAGNMRAATRDSRIGDDGTSQFAAMSITGESAIVTFIPGANQHASEFGEIDFYYHGTEGQDGGELVTPNFTAEPSNLDTDVGTFSTCGAMERRNVQCWAQSHPTEFERSRPVARLIIGGSSLCTAWRVGPDNRMFTNNHCVETAAELTATEVWFNYQRKDCNGNTNETVVKVTGKDFLKTDYTLDYTLFTINDFAKAAPFGYFGLDVRNANQGERIYIPQHGSGNPKELAIESDQDTNGLCSVNQASANGRGTNTDIGYYCDTIGGSSGSPVLAAATNKVIALHHLGGCTNKGAKVSLIWPQVATHFNNQIPEGDNGNTTPLPVASFAANCTLLNCQFDASNSSSPNGNISNYQWQFGDGSADVGVTSNHTYANSGSYSVTLTVTDSAGETASTTQTVAVSQSNDSVLQKGVAKTGLAAAKGENLMYYIDIPANAGTVSFVLSGGSGDADLYVRKDLEPTTSSYDCRPFKLGNNETCSLNAGAGRYYVMVRAYSAFSGVSLVANY